MKFHELENGQDFRFVGNPLDCIKLKGYRYQTLGHGTHRLNVGENPEVELITGYAANAMVSTPKRSQTSRGRCID